jgi:hypothetical protein
LWGQVITTATIVNAGRAAKRAPRVPDVLREIARQPRGPHISVSFRRLLETA